MRIGRSEPVVWHRLALPQAMRRQLGASLIVSLLMLMAVFMLGASAAQIALQEEKASRNNRDRQIALQAAESALSDAQLDVEQSPRSYLFTGDHTEVFAEDCGSGRPELYLGLCRSAGEGSVPVWQAVDFLGLERVESVPYGHFTGRQLQTGAGPLPARPPRYIIEPMSYTGSKDAADKGKPVRFYRITAIGFGMRESTQVVLQTFYRRNDGEEVQAVVPSGRFGWREISNWQELRNAHASS